MSRWTPPIELLVCMCGVWQGGRLTVLMSLYTSADVPLQKKLLDPDNTTTTVHDDFLREFAEVVGTGRAISILFCINGVRNQRSHLVGPPFPEIKARFSATAGWHFSRD